MRSAFHCAYVSLPLRGLLLPLPFQARTCLASFVHSIYHLLLYLLVLYLDCCVYTNFEVYRDSLWSFLLFVSMAAPHSAPDRGVAYNYLSVRMMIARSGNRMPLLDMALLFLMV